MINSKRSPKQKQIKQTLQNLENVYIVNKI